MTTEKKAGHTKGPWECEPSKVGGLFNVWGAREENRLKGMGPTSIISPTANEANARLIASAPELLEYLRRLAFNLEHIQSRPELKLDVSWMHEALALIAKAEGRK
jgi:hypothetical protein